MTVKSLVRTSEKRYNYPVSRCGSIREWANESGNPERGKHAECRVKNG